MGDAGPILLTGATGFVGGHLTRALLARGAEVVALTRPGSTHRLPAGVRGEAIPASEAELEGLVAAARPRACVHLATLFLAQHRPEDVVPLLEANVVLGTRLAQALTSVGGIPLVDVGTVWQHVDGAEYRPANLYAATKQAQADLLTAFALRDGLPLVRMTLTDTYGPGDTRPRLVPMLVRAAVAARPVDLSSGHQLVDLVHVDDVVTAFLRVLAALDGERDRLVPAADASTRFGVSSGAPVTVRDLVAVLGSVAPHPVDARWGARPDRPVEMRDPWDPGPPPPGWAPEVALAEGLAALVATEAGQAGG